MLVLLMALDDVPKTRVINVEVLELQRKCRHIMKDDVLVDLNLEKIKGSLTKATYYHKMHNSHEC